MSQYGALSSGSTSAGRRRRSGRKAGPSAAQLQQAEALEDLRGDLREAELKIDGLAAKSAQQERLIALLERSNARVLEENDAPRRLVLANAVDAA